MTETKEKIAWLVERRDRGNIEYLHFAASGLGWTKDVNRATKFADEKSAEGASSVVSSSIEVFVCEHGWPDGW